MALRGLRAYEKEAMEQVIADYNKNKYKQTYSAN
jgi:hypothetical protein